jgi:triphosphatase
MSRELELCLKVELSCADAARLVGELLARELAIGPPATKKVRTIYFDAPGYDLNAADITLRLRRQDGFWLQSVKANQKNEGGLSNPVETETRLKGDVPDTGNIADQGVKTKVQKALDGAPLHPIFETRVQRTTRNIKTSGSVIELAADEGEVVAGAKGAPSCARWNLSSNQEAWRAC